MRSSLFRVKREIDTPFHMRLSHPRAVERGRALGVGRFSSFQPIF